MADSTKQGQDVQPMQDPPSYTPRTEQMLPQHPMAPSTNTPANVTRLDQLGDNPSWIDCVFCEQRTMTKVDHKDSSATVLAAVLCCLVCICAVCIPHYAGWFVETDHYCTNCNARVSHKPHDGPVEVMQPVRRPVTTQYGNAEPAVAMQPAKLSV